MSLKPTITLNEGCSIAATGGSALEFKQSSTPVSNGVLFIVPGDDYRTRRQIVAQHKSSVQSPGRGFSFDTTKVAITCPTLDSLDVVHRNAIRLELTSHPTQDAADKAAMIMMMAQFLIEAAHADLFAWGSLE